MGKIINWEWEMYNVSSDVQVQKIMPNEQIDFNKEFRVERKLAIRGIFDGEHYFILKELKKGQTKFIQGENFSGILVPVMRNALTKTKEGFKMMNESFKRACEKKDNLI